MSCDEVETLLAIHAVDGLDADEVRSVSTHLEGCVACRRAGEGFLRTAALLPLALPQRTPPAHLRHRLMAEVYAEAAGSPRRPRLHQRIWARVPAGRPFAFAAGGLAAAAAVTVIALLPLGRAAPVLPGARTVAVTLHGTTAMPLAHGRLDYDPQQHQAVVTAQGLTPQSSDGTAAPPPIYELWLIRSNSAAVPAGVLSLGPDGHTWMAAVRLNARDYQSVATTIEPAGGSSTPTGPEVLQARLNG